MFVNTTKDFLKNIHAFGNELLSVACSATYIYLMIVTKTQFYNSIEVRQLGIKFTIKLYSRRVSVSRVFHLICNFLSGMYL